MPFDPKFSDQSVPYYKPVAPEVPQPDNTAAKIISAGTQAGVMGFVHMAIAAKQAQLEQQQILQKSDLAAQQLGYEDKWNTDKHELDKTIASQMNTYRTGMLGVAQQNADTLEQYRKDEIQAAGDKLKAQNILTSTYATTEAKNDHAVMDDVHKFGLDDNTKWNDDPVGQIAKLNDLKVRYGTAQVGAAPEIIAGLNSKANNIKVPFLPGAQYSEIKDPATGKSAYQWSGADQTGKPVTSPMLLPLPKLLEMYNDPTQRPSVENGLIAAGHGHIVDQITNTPSSGFLGFRRNVKNTAHTPVLDEYGNKLLVAAGKMQPSTEQNRVPSALQQSRPPQWLIKSGGAPSDAAADPATVEAQHVKSLMSGNPQYAPQLRATFYNTYPDFDPNSPDAP